MKKFDVYKLRMRYKGVFELAGLYKVMTDWFVMKGYEFHETQYRQKSHFHNPTIYGNELEIQYKAWRKPNDLVIYHVFVWIHMWDIDNVEVIKDGEKRPAYRCRMEIEIDGRFDTDPAERWEQSGFKRAVEDFMNKYLFYRKITLYDDDIRYSVHVLHDKIKHYLDFETKGNEYAGLSR